MGIPFRERNNSNGSFLFTKKASKSSTGTVVRYPNNITILQVRLYKCMIEHYSCIRKISAYFCNDTNTFIIIIIIITSNLFTRSKSQPYRRIRGTVQSQLTKGKLKIVSIKFNKEPITVFTRGTVRVPDSDDLKRRPETYGVILHARQDG